jgi:hypothetical protein
MVYPAFLDRYRYESRFSKYLMTQIRGRILDNVLNEKVVTFHQNQNKMTL